MSILKLIGIVKMPLILETFSVPMTNNYHVITNLDSNSEPNGWGVPDNPSYGIMFANNYDAYVQGGIVQGATNDGRKKEILISFFNSFPSQTTDNAFAVALASYWATVALIPGPPGYGGAPVSVTNDAMSLVSDFEAAIKASYRTSLSVPYYAVFIGNIESMAVSKIKWTVTENFGPAGNIPFISKVT